jgi:Amt family ammonium transporter
VFGIHGVCGIVGAMLTGVFTAPALGRHRRRGLLHLPPSSACSCSGVMVTIAWSGVVALFAFRIARRVRGLRVDHDAEREGLDISAHGENAYEI